MAMNVCMGTVNIDIQNSASVEEFIQAWKAIFQLFQYIYWGITMKSDKIV
jgi:hypothetical protein